MRTGIRLAMLALAAAAGPAWAEDKADKDRALTDERFVEMAATGGQAEVAMGRLGQEQATSPDVKRFAARMVADHTKANEELMRTIHAHPTVAEAVMEAAHAAAGAAIHI